ncbi:wall-associated receptor kinase-like 22 [Hevea brasiliensis]|uniref:wall-associated receptor kinase-like 22 n=1 Tax=Hevea brasiliensis TaxID=3981 RepID=UPI0025DF3328|nr:wall-associated receptor kinase-like 22 [Hevea brasiliensis]
MSVKLVSQVSFSLALLLTIQLAIAKGPTAKPSCTDHCGNIDIPYPFGMGEKDCYFNEWFEIECNESRAFISKIKMELLNISVEGWANVKSPIISSDCSDWVSDLPFNLTGSPFFISDYNVFTAVGCNTRALMINQSLQRLGCDSKCLSHKKDVDWRQMLPNFIEEDSSSNYLIANDYCNGTDCCQVKIPSSLQVFNASFQAINNQSTDGCKLAFLAGTYPGNSWRKKDPNVQFPMVLDWMLYSNRTESYNWIINSSLWSGNNSESESLACFPDGSSSINEAAVFWCYCRRGYEGNPYIRCTDVDECEDPKFRGHCKGITRCVNTSGSFKCVPDAKWIILLCTGGIIGVLVIVFGIQMLCKLMKKRRNIQLKKKFFERNGGLLLRQQLTSSDGSVKKTQIFTSKELEKATDRFNDNRILGQGGQGTVYKGMLADGRIVAVKMSKLVDEENLQEFINELVILSQINHRNVVRLLGCCLETEVPLLVYEFIPNGSLFQYLHDQSEEASLPWEMRVRIASEIAGALAYLHSAASIPVYHRDIKSTNILLDEKHRAKVSDFGTSRSIAIDQTHLTTHVHGTFGYLDPEYFQSSQFTDKSDVYSFGVVLVELLSGQKPIYLSSSQETMSLATNFILLMEESRLFDIIDARITEDCHDEEIVAVANLALRCLNLNGKKRPTMKEVTIELERIRASPSNKLNVEQNTEKTENTEEAAEVIMLELDDVPTSITRDFSSVEASPNH